MHRLCSIYLILAVFFACTSCSNKQYQALFQERTIMPADTTSAKPAAVAYQYHIKPQDILEIRNLQNSKNIVDLNPAQGGASTQGGASNVQETYQVEEDGTVALTGLGHVPVVGLTRYEAQKKIEDLYQKAILKQPIIELKIVNLKVTILGEIKSQGNYQLVKDKTTLVELIGEAGGLTDKANEKTIKIIRGEQNPTVTVINLNNIGAINDPAALLQNGDIIYVAQSKRASRADNLQSFSTLVQPALILFNTALIILTLVRK
jgi:polysaccharide biosynthesis/export protein